MRIANYTKKQKTHTHHTNYLTIITIILILIAILIYIKVAEKTSSQFHGERAYKDVEYQVSLGPRTLGSAAHREEESWIASELKMAGWEVETLEQSWNGHQIQNVVGMRGKGGEWVILGAHYDSRFSADRDPDLSLQSQPVPGANDGASGVAVLLELARCLPENTDKKIWLVFFDAEDNGNLPGYEWIMGSRSFVSNLPDIPDHVIVIDMIGDKDLNIYKEQNSNDQLNDSIWTLASRLGYKEFIPKPKYRILDDHIPFIEVGIPAVDIIDFDYPYWHTTQDTFDKISAESLQVVGETLRAWLLESSK